MADTKFFFILLTVLALITIPTALIIVSYNDWNSGISETGQTCENISQFGAYCPKPQNPTISESYSGTINLTTTNVDNVSYVTIQKKLPLSDIPAWYWNTAIGYISTWGLNDNKHIFLNGVQKINGWYKTSYTVNNTVKKEFLIVLHAGNLHPLNFLRDLVLEFSANEVRIPGWVPYTYEKTVSVPGLFNNPNLLIKTEYNPDTHLINCYVNNALIINNISQNEFSLNVWGSVTHHVDDWYGGIGTKETGITLTSYYTEGGQSLAGISSTEPSIWDRILDLVPWGREIWNFASIFLNIINPFANVNTLDLTGQPIIPWFMSVFIDIMIIGIIAYGITILRGN